MDRGTWFGLLLGVTLLGLAIGFGPNPRIFFHLPSTLVVVGGVIAATFIRFPLGHVSGAFRIASRAFFTRIPDPHDVVRQIVGISQVAKRQGVQNLERQFTLEGFLGQGVQLVQDRLSRELIEDRLAREIQATQERHSQGQDLFRFIATAAPSFGMVGTLIGMVQLFATLKDPTGVGGAMALSLLSTLYGAVIAYLIAIPMAGKLELRSREEIQMKRLMMEGILGIEAEMNPSILESQLLAHLAPQKQARILARTR